MKEEFIKVREWSCKNRKGQLALIKRLDGNYKAIRGGIRRLAGHTSNLKRKE